MPPARASDARRSRPAGTSFTFEAGVAKLKGGQGWADVWKRGFFTWEYKGKHADLGRFSDSSRLAMAKYM